MACIYVGTGHVFDACTATYGFHIGRKRLENPYGIKTFTRFELKINPTAPTCSQNDEASVYAHTCGWM